VAVLWTALAPTHTGSHAGKQVKGFQNRNRSKYSRLGLGEPYTPNRSVTALVVTRSCFFVFSLAFGKREDVSVWSG
jgi:hypothetical protein